jgi:hypothetical protein
MPSRADDRHIRPSARDVLPCENVMRDGRKQCNVRFQRHTECGITNAQDFRRLGSTLKMARRPRWVSKRDVLQTL